MAEPALFSFSVTKYFTPLLAPAVILKSNWKINASYSGGNGGFGEGSYGTAVTGLVGTGGKPGGSGGSYGKDGSAGSSYNKTSVGGKGGLAGYYIKIEYTPNNDVSYSYVKGLGGFVDGRIG